MPDPLRPDFWEIVRPTLAPAREAGRAYIASGKFVERSDERKYTESNEGWPLVTGSRLFPKGAPRWRSLFSVKAGQFSKVLVDDVPELRDGMNAAVARAEQDSTFAEGLDLTYAVMTDPERRTLFAQIEFLSVVGDILGRAEDLGLEDDESLFDLYQQIERGRFSSELTGDIVVPLVLTTFETATPVQLLDSFWLEPLEEPIQRSRALDDNGAHAVSPMIAAAATHAIVQRDQTFPNTVWSDAYVAGANRVPFELDTVHRILECIHIVTGKKTGYSQILVRSDSWVSWSGWIADLPHVWKAQSVKAYPDSFDRGWLRPKDPISAGEVEEIVAVLPALLASPKNVRLASRRCFRSTFRDDIEDEILDATIGIEALLSQDRDELTHRMSQRAAAALAGEFRADAIYRILKQVYGQRSQIVHGTTLKNSKVKFGDVEFWTNHMGVFLLRNLLRNYLLSPTPWTPSSLDDVILTRLGHINDEGPV
ncbi:hypothetical protein [Nocardioides sp.]|uniref:hypothetical protein n=1 Tax=Nocardioides sp. TaxID=35761 RepID=UPI003784EDAC